MCFRTRNCKAITIQTLENSRKNRIASTNGHRVLKRKRNFQALGKLFLNPNSGSDLPAAARSINLIY